MGKYKFVNEIVDVRDFKKEELNLIVSGTGTGKSYWALEYLIKDLHKQGIDVKQSEIYFVTSRRITADQQAEGYKNCAAKLHTGHIFNGAGFTEEYNEIPIMTYSQFAYLIDENKVFAKYVIFDEIHSVVIDSSYQQCMKTIKDYIMMDKETIKIAMTATDFVVKENNFNIKINKLIDKVNNRFEVEDELILTYQRNLHLLLNESENKSIVMVNTMKQAEYLQNRLTKNSAILCSKYSQHFTKDMEDMYDYIKNNKAIPDEIDVLICTTCGREGFEIKNSIVENVVVYGADAINIIQFLGRYRGNAKRLILVNDFFRATGKANIDKMLEDMNKEYYNMYNLVGTRLTYKVSNYYVKYLRYSLGENIKVSKYTDDDAFMLFLSWINENWTERLIYTKEHKKEITDKALEFGLRKPDRKKHTFQSLMSKIKDDAKEFTFAIEGKMIRKNNNLIEQYRGLEEIESDTIRPYILLNLDKYELYAEEDLSEEEILAKFVKWFNENYTDEVIYKKEDFINIVDTACRMGLRDKKGRKYEIVELIKILELLTHNQRGFIYLAGDRKFKNNSYDEIEKYKTDESCIVNKEGYEIEIDQDDYNKIISTGNIILFVEREILELITK